MIAVFKLVKSALQFVYALLVQPFWWMLDDRFDIQHAACVLSLKQSIKSGTPHGNPEREELVGEHSSIRSIRKGRPSTEMLGLAEPLLATDEIPEYGIYRLDRMRSCSDYLRKYWASIK